MPILTHPWATAACNALESSGVTLSTPVLASYLVPQELALHSRPRAVYGYSVSEHKPPSLAAYFIAPVISPPLHPSHPYRIQEHSTKCCSDNEFKVPVLMA
eukprot:713169_1